MEEQETSPGKLERRGFMALASRAIAAAIGAAYAVPAIAYLLGPSLKQKVEEWLPLASRKKIEIGTPELFKTNVERKTGWISDEEEIFAYVLTDDGREYIAMSNICTHLGCRVHWVADKEQFYCPCHNGVYDKYGNVVSGPPPRPLDRYPVNVEGDEISILAG